MSSVMSMSQPDEGTFILLSDVLSYNQVVTWRASLEAPTKCSPAHHACGHTSENCHFAEDDVAGGLPAIEESLDVFRWKQLKSYYSFVVENNLKHPATVWNGCACLHCHSTPLQLSKGFLVLVLVSQPKLSAGNLCNGQVTSGSTGLDAAVKLQPRVLLTFHSHCIKCSEALQKINSNNLVFGLETHDINCSCRFWSIRIVCWVLLAKSLSSVSWMASSACIT